MKKIQISFVCKNWKPYTEKNLRKKKNDKIKGKSKKITKTLLLTPFFCYHYHTSYHYVTNPIITALSIFYLFNCTLHHHPHSHPSSVQQRLSRT